MSDSQLPNILILGATGAGKSSFVHGVTGCTNVTLGADLNSLTKTITSCKMTYGTTSCNILDTPGFDSTDSGNELALQELQAWSKDPANVSSLAGVVVLHPITENRLRGSTQTLLQLIDKLCTRAGIDSLLLITTFWDRIDRTEGIAREEQLAQLDGTWKSLVERGCVVRRSARDYKRFPPLLAKMADSYLEELQAEQTYIPVPPVVSVEEEQEHLDVLLAQLELKRQYDIAAEKQAIGDAKKRQERQQAEQDPQKPADEMKHTRQRLEAAVQPFYHGFAHQRQKVNHALDRARATVKANTLYQHVAGIEKHDVVMLTDYNKPERRL